MPFLDQVLSMTMKCIFLLQIQELFSKAILNFDKYNKGFERWMCHILGNQDLTFFSLEKLENFVYDENTCN